MNMTVLLIEDDPEHQQLLSRVLREGATSCEVLAEGRARVGLQLLAERQVDCVVLDYRLPDLDGLACLRAIREAHHDVPIVMLTGHGSEEVVRQAMHLGATDYIAKRGRFLPELRDCVRRALEGSGRLLEVSPSPRLPFAVRRQLDRDGVIGNSPAFEEVLRLAERYAATEATALIQGETGTGKEVLARVIHSHGPRARGPFLVQNCAALPETLLDSELFGCVRGAYTGADRKRAGLFAAAGGGTLCLDEVTETSLAFQAKLLGVLQNHMVRPLGAAEAHPVDVRVIAATNRDPWRAVESGMLREDLYYRLNVLPLRVPALRDRRGDVALLALHFLRKFSRREGKRLADIDRQTRRVLEAYPWPGNVRELENEIHRAVVAAGAEATVLTPDLLSPGLATPHEASVGPDAPLKSVVDAVTRRTIIERLRANGGRRAPTARSLGVSREWLWELMRRLEIRESGPRP